MRKKKLISLLVCMLLIATQFSMLAPSYAAGETSQTGMNAVSNMGVGIGMNAGNSMNAGIGMNVGGPINAGPLNNPLAAKNIVYEENEDYIIYKSAEEVESMTDIQLIKEVNSRPKYYIPGFYKPDDFGIRLEDGEVWHELMLRSVFSIYDAITEVNAYAY